MVAIVQITADPTLAAIDAAMVAAQERGSRPYLGMSALGHPCDRNLWYSFRFATEKNFDATTLKRFEDGHRGEDVQADRLRLVAGIELHTIDSRTGQQFGFSLCGGHVKGHMDGAILGLLQAPKTWHVWEHKQVGETKFKKLQKLKAELGEKNALKEWDKTYYAQAQLYMQCSGMDRHYLTCATPGGRETISVRTNIDHHDAEQLLIKAQRIIDAKEPPSGISTDPSWYECKFCDYHSLCFEQAVPQPTCRSCAHSTPTKNAKWQCEKQNCTKTTTEQKAGCDSHLFIPALFGNFADAVEADAEGNWIVYRNKKTGKLWSNGTPPNGYASKEICLIDKAMLGDEVADEIRFSFDARVVA